jgi:uncharacterized membrane protein YqjE
MLHYESATTLTQPRGYSHAESLSHVVSRIAHSGAPSPQLVPGVVPPLDESITPGHVRADVAEDVVERDRLLVPIKSTTMFRARLVRPFQFSFKGLGPGQRDEQREEGEGESMGTEELSDQSLSELVQRLSNQTAGLVRKEIRLAQLELQEKGKRAGIGAGLLGGGGLVALYGLGALVAAAILALVTVIAPWLAALIVALALFAIAGVLFLSGRRQVQRATPPKPEAAIESVQSDIAEVKERAGRK